MKWRDITKTDIDEVGKMKNIVSGVLYFVICIISTPFVKSAFAYFQMEPDITNLCLLIIISFAWWKSISGMCRNIIKIEREKLN